MVSFLVGGVLMVMVVVCGCDNVFLVMCLSLVCLMCCFVCVLC